MSSNRVIDAHSHIGIDNAWSHIGCLEEYVQHSTALGVCKSILMPVPMPILKVGSCKVIPVMVGTYEDEIFIVNGIEDCYGLRAVPVQENPYQYANELLYHKISTYRDGNLDLYFVPLIHPVLDTTEYLESIIQKYNPVALKIHGYSSLISPFEISPLFFEIIQSNHIPLIIHTDCDINVDENSFDSYLRNENSPLNWLSLLSNYDIKAYITHGARLSDESIDIVNQSPNFVIGLGPDNLLSHEDDRLYSNDPYLGTLFSKVDIDKICFDLDYPWNVISYNNDEFDWDSLNRINALNLTDFEKEKVYYKNANDFFHLK